jgi:NAD(P)H-dependent FMN reductase
LPKSIFAICGSASPDSANEKLLLFLAKMPGWNVELFTDLKSLPHFDPALSTGHPPAEIVAFRRKIAEAEGVIICTPEYIFSLPAGLKNALEWCVATTLFTDKPVGLITASASGEKGQEALQLIMKTLGAQLSPTTTLLLQGVKSKVSASGEIVDAVTKETLQKFKEAFSAVL